MSEMLLEAAVLGGKRETENSSKQKSHVRLQQATQHDPIECNHKRSSQLGSQLKLLDFDATDTSC